MAAVDVSDGDEASGHYGFCASVRCGANWLASRGARSKQERLEPMELNLQPRALACFVTGQPFREGDRVTSLLVRTDSGEIVALRRPRGERGLAGAGGIRRLQLGAGLQAAGRRRRTRERALKLTAENLFLTLADPSTRARPRRRARLVRFLALLLERKRSSGRGGAAPDGDAGALRARPDEAGLRDRGHRADAGVLHGGAGAADGARGRAVRAAGRRAGRGRARLRPDRESLLGQVALEPGDREGPEVEEGRREGRAGAAGAQHLREMLRGGRRPRSRSRARGRRRSPGA